MADRPDLPSIEELTRRPGPGSHRTVLTIDGRPTETLADLPPLPGHLLFVGLHPSPVSVEAGHYHQGRLGRRFWTRLEEATILPPDTDALTADDALLAAGHGITDLLKHATAADEATADELRAAVGPLWQRISVWRPGAVVFVYKRAAEAAAGRELSEPWGRLEGIAMSGRPCFLMPGPYAAAVEVAKGLNLLRNLASLMPQ
jgi:TDG/mug DNA glycosylase family protein